MRPNDLPKEASQVPALVSTQTEKESEVCVTASGVVIVDPVRAIRLLKQNGTLDAARKFMRFTKVNQKQAPK